MIVGEHSRDSDLEVRGCMLIMIHYLIVSSLT
jgi:hypothetical protein